MFSDQKEIQSTIYTVSLEHFFFCVCQSSSQLIESIRSENPKRGRHVVHTIREKIGQ